MTRFGHVSAAFALASTAWIARHAAAHWKKYLAALLMAASAFFWLLPPLVTLIVNKVYLNVAEPLHEETAVTATQFRSSPEIVSTLGGRGLGLNCSLPWHFDHVFRKTTAMDRYDRRSVRERFHQACVFHDFCYRHGLATYGYTQDDCDDLLQEQALQICVSSGRKLPLREHGRDDCQLDAKKIVLGVRLAGHKSFYEWGKSTYFEFDPLPHRSPRFFALRVFEHPFKARITDRFITDPKQLLVEFTVLRSGTRFRCRTCGPEVLDEQEFALAGAEKPPGYGKNDFVHRMNEEHAIWLPPGRFWSAPTLLIEGQGKNKLVWPARHNLESSQTCLVSAEPPKLFTSTLPDRAGCGSGLTKHLSLRQPDLNSSAVVIAPVWPSADAVRVGQPEIVGAGLSAQSPDLQLCVSEDLLVKPRLPKGENERTCHPLLRSGQRIIGLERWAVFQYAPIVRGQSLLQLMRKESAELTAIGFDIPHDRLKGRPIALQFEKQVVIDSSFDPMVPLRDDPMDLRLLSMKVFSPAYLPRWVTKAFGRGDPTLLKLQEIDFASGEPRPAELKVHIKEHDAAIHGSWSDRPLLVLEDALTDGARVTRLVLSRGIIGLAEDARRPHGEETEKVRFQVAVLERPIATKGEPLQVLRIIDCRISYTIQADEDNARPCSRSIRTTGPGRATPATMLIGAQLIVGRFSVDNSQQLALFDRCRRDRPLILGSVAGDSAREPEDLVPPSTATQTPRRTLACTVSTKVEAKQLANVLTWP